MTERDVRLVVICALRRVIARGRRLFIRLRVGFATREIERRNRVDEIRDFEEARLDGLRIELRENDVARSNRHRTALLEVFAKLRHALFLVGIAAELGAIALFKALALNELRRTELVRKVLCNLRRIDSSRASLGLFLGLRLVVSRLALLGRFLFLLRERTELCDLAVDVVDFGIDGAELVHVFGLLRALDELCLLCLAGFNHAFNRVIHLSSLLLISR